MRLTHRAPTRRFAAPTTKRGQGPPQHQWSAPTCNKRHHSSHLSPQLTTDRTAHNETEPVDTSTDNTLNPPQPRTRDHHSNRAAPICFQTGRPPFGHTAAPRGERWEREVDGLVSVGCTPAPETNCPFAFHHRRTPVAVSDVADEPAAGVGLGGRLGATRPPWRFGVRR